MIFYHNTRERLTAVCPDPGSCTAAPAYEHYGSKAEAEGELQGGMPSAQATLGTRFQAGVASDSANVKLALAGPGAKNKVLALDTFNLGRINPTTGEGCKNSDLDVHDAAILATSGGARARTVILTRKNLIAADAEALGQAILQYKNAARTSKTEGLYVVGYRTADGETFGWIPDAKIHYFKLY